MKRRPSKHTVCNASDDTVGKPYDLEVIVDAVVRAVDANASGQQRFGRH